MQLYHFWKYELFFESIFSFCAVCIIISLFWLENCNLVSASPTPLCYIKEKGTVKDSIFDTM